MCKPERGGSGACCGVTAWGQKHLGDGHVEKFYCNSTGRSPRGDVLCHQGAPVCVWGSSVHHKSPPCIVPTLPIPTLQQHRGGAPTPIAVMRELKPREVKCLTWSHAGSQWQGREDPKPPQHFPKPSPCTWPSCWPPFPASSVRTFTLCAFPAGFQGRPDELLLVLGERRRDRRLVQVRPQRLRRERTAELQPPPAAHVCIPAIPRSPQCPPRSHGMWLSPRAPPALHHRAQGCRPGRLAA